MKLEGKREEEGSVDKLTLQTLIDRMHHHTICILLTSKAQKQTAPLMEAVRMQRHIYSLGDSHPSRLRDSTNEVHAFGQRHPIIEGGLHMFVQEQLCCQAGDQNNVLVLFFL